MPARKNSFHVRIFAKNILSIILTETNKCFSIPLSWNNSVISEAMDTNRKRHTFKCKSKRITLIRF